MGLVCMKLPAGFAQLPPFSGGREIVCFMSLQGPFMQAAKLCTSLHGILSTTLEEFFAMLD